MMKVISHYFERHVQLAALIGSKPLADLEMIVVIPAHNEPIDFIRSCLESLKQAHDYHPIQLEVILLFNASESDDPIIHELNRLGHQFADAWAHEHNNQKMQCHPLLFNELNKKKAGVGLARKMGMDEALARFYSIEKNGLIINLDADTQIHENYFAAIAECFTQDPKCAAAGIYFEHPLFGLTDEQKNAIIQYELHLRYFINMQRWVGLPYSFQTIGSAMVCRAWDYARLGGMNTRKAGEDFYFLHKFISNRLFKDLNSTAVFPSARSSDRVPFGTGKAVADFIEDDEKERLTYHPESFEKIKDWLAHLPSWYLQTKSKIETDMKSWDADLRSYLIEQKFIDVIAEIKSNVSSSSAFDKRFYKWFDAFKLMKLLHFMRDRNYPDQVLSEGLKYLFPKLNLEYHSDLHGSLLQLRKYDRTNPWNGLSM